LNYVMFL